MPGLLLEILKAAALARGRPRKTSLQRLTTTSIHRTTMPVGMLWRQAAIFHLAHCGGRPQRATCTAGVAALTIDGTIKSAARRMHSTDVL
mmetsp:Transcript_40237/g.93179  ORF Transcript_40237/g.93179 Transcript_40237/m.93179 type:complete len:90 (+) Transcript_40237:278-547(+)